MHAGDHESPHLVTLLNLDGGHAIGMSGKDGGLLRAQGGELAISVDAAVLEMLLGQGYVPVISPIALGDDGAELRARRRRRRGRSSRSRCARRS